MLNLTEIRNQTVSTEDFFCSSTLSEPKPRIIASAFNIPLCITAFIGNVLIIVVLPKVSSLHPPSKLLLGCLASTDLWVGLVAQPLYVFLLLSSKYSKHYCYYLGIFYSLASAIFCAASLMTLTAISVDRLLALTLGLQYRQVVTLKRVWVLVVTLWLFNMKNAVMSILNLRIAYSIFSTEVILCIIASIFCYTKIYCILRQNRAQVQPHVHQGQQNQGQNAMKIARYRKTVSTALWVPITLLTYLPFVAVAAVISFYGPVPSLAWHLPVTLVMLNSTLNPFLYCWKIREMKQAVIDMITQLLEPCVAANTAMPILCLFFYLINQHRNTEFWRA